MAHERHYLRTKAAYRQVALERDGYYDAASSGPPRHTIWQQIARKWALATLDDLLGAGADIRSALDAGCGRGDFTLELARRYPQLTRVCGCDFVTEAIDIARLEARALRSVHFSQADLRQLPFATSGFDLVVCINVLHHIHRNDLLGVLYELCRVANTSIIIEIKNKDSLRTVRPTLGIDVFRTSVETVTRSLNERGFVLRRALPIFGIKFLSPIILLLYMRKISLASS